MSSTCRRFALHDAGGLQRMGEDGVTGRRPTVVVAVAVPQDDEVWKRSQAGPAPSIIGGRPWSTMPVSTCHWKAPAYALWTQQGESCARPRWPASQRP